MIHKKPYLEHLSQLSIDGKTITFPELKCDCCDKPLGVFGASVSYEGMNAICPECRASCYANDQYHCDKHPNVKLAVHYPICTPCIEESAEAEVARNTRRFK
jgi:hypothetical protein